MANEVQFRISHPRKIHPSSIIRVQIPGTFNYVKSFHNVNNVKILMFSKKTKNVIFVLIFLVIPVCRDIHHNSNYIVD